MSASDHASTTCDYCDEQVATEVEYVMRRHPLTVTTMGTWSSFQSNTIYYTIDNHVDSVQRYRSTLSCVVVKSTRESGSVQPWMCTMLLSTAQASRLWPRGYGWLAFLKAVLSHQYRCYDLAMVGFVMGKYGSTTREYRQSFRALAMRGVVFSMTLAQPDHWLLGQSYCRAFSTVVLLLSGLLSGN